MMAEVVKEFNPQTESTFLVRKWKTLLGEYLVSAQGRVKVSLTLTEANKLVRVLVRTAFAVGSAKVFGPV